MILLVLIAFVVLFLTIFGLGMWFGAGKFANDHSEKLGTSVASVLIHFILVVIIILALLYFTVGIDDCSGFLCKLDMLLVFLVSSSVIFLTWPVVLHLYFKKKKSDYKKNPSTDR